MKKAHFIDQQLQAPDGALLRYRERPGAFAASPTVVLLHSLFFDARMFDAVAPMLPQNWQILCPDHRGQGGSEAGVLPLSMEQLSRDVEVLIETRCAGPVHLVGSSMGGYVALELAMRRPELLASCVLSCCTAAAEVQMERFNALESALRSQGPAALVDALLGTMFGSHFLQHGGSALAFWRAQFASRPHRVADAVHGVFARGSYEQGLGGLRMPLLLLSGELDRAKRPQDMQAIADRVGGSRHIVFAQAGHTPPVEVPELYAQTLMQFWKSEFGNQFE